MYQCVLLKKTNATAASARSQYPRNNDSGCRSAKTDVVGPAAANQEQTNGRTQASERGRRSCCGAFCPTTERAGGRARARPPRRLCPPTNEQIRGRSQSPLLRWFCPTVSDVSHVESVRRLPSVSQSVREPILLPNRGLSFGPQLSVLLGGEHVQ